MRRFYIEADREHARELRAQGLTLPIISERTGVPLSTLKTWFMSPQARAHRQQYQRGGGRKPVVSSAVPVYCSAGCGEKLRDPSDPRCGWCRELAEQVAA